MMSSTTAAAAGLRAISVCNFSVGDNEGEEPIGGDDDGRMCGLVLLESGVCLLKVRMLGKGATSFGGRWPRLLIGGDVNEVRPIVGRDESLRKVTIRHLVETGNCRQQLGIGMLR